MINFSVGLRPNPMKPDEGKKAYAYMQARETMDINKFAEQGVLYRRTCCRRQDANGHENACAKGCIEALAG